MFNSSHRLFSVLTYISTFMIIQSLFSNIKDHSKVKLACILPLELPECQVRHTSCDLTRKCTQPEGQLSSVNFPNQYFYQGSSCTWQIATRESTYITMRFLAFDVPSWDVCISSFLSIHDGPNDQSYVLGKHCNLHLPPTNMRTGFNFAYIWLRTTTGNPGAGFHLDYASEVFTPAQASANATGKYLL